MDLDFLNRITGRTKEITKTATDRVNYMLEINRMNSRLHMEEEEVKELTHKIGTYYVAKLDAKEITAEEEVMDLYRAIVNCQEKMETLQADIQHLKELSGKNSAKTIQCTFCGFANPAESKFCGDCGAKLEPEDKGKLLCSNCGAELVEGLKFCGECGQRIDKME